jgi:hypothetical protein
MTVDPPPNIFDSAFATTAVRIQAGYNIIFLQGDSDTVEKPPHNEGEFELLLQPSLEQLPHAEIGQTLLDEVANATHDQEDREKHGFTRVRCSK